MAIAVAACGHDVRRPRADSLRRQERGYSLDGKSLACHEECPRARRARTADETLRRFAPLGRLSARRCANDVFHLINFLYASGPAPVGSGDVDGSGSVNAADVLYLLNFLFGGGPAPV